MQFIFEILAYGEESNGFAARLSGMFRSGTDVLTGCEGGGTAGSGDILRENSF